MTWPDIPGFIQVPCFQKKIYRKKLAVRSIESAPMIEIIFVTSSISSASVRNKTENPSKDADVSTYPIKDDLAECGSIVYR